MSFDGDDRPEALFVATCFWGAVLVLFVCGAIYLHDPEASDKRERAFYEWCESGNSYLMGSHSAAQCLVHLEAKKQKEPHER